MRHFKRTKTIDTIKFSIDRKVHYMRPLHTQDRCLRETYNTLDVMGSRDKYFDIFQSIIITRVDIANSVNLATSMEYFFIWFS